jgi:tRNA 2-thiocytidine biosynthesis protein TtcA
MNKSDVKQIKKLEKKVYSLCGDVIGRYRMIEGGDRLLVALSGGKDSYMLMDTLIHFKMVAPIDFDLNPVHIDIGYKEGQVKLIKAFTESKGYELKVVAEDISPLIEKHINNNKNPCSLCSRIRRGALYSVARDLGCNKVALGHHKNDLIETFLLNILYNGTIATMPVNYSTVKEGIRVIRPLAPVKEEYISQYARINYKDFIYHGERLCPFVKNKDNLKRERVKQLITALKNDMPDVENSLFASLSNIHTREMLDLKVNKDMIDINAIE